MDTFLSQVATVKVDNWNKDNGFYVEYCLIVSLKNNYCYQIDKRYKDFKLFYDSVCDEGKFKFNLPFPAKQLLTHSASCLSERAEFFEKLLEYCQTVEDFSEKLCNFLRVPRKIPGAKVVPTNDDSNNILEATPSSDTPSGSAIQWHCEDEGGVNTVDVAPVLNEPNANVPASGAGSLQQPRKSARRSKRSSVYFKNLMEEVDMDRILEKKEDELTDEELLLLSRRQATGQPPSGAVSELFKLTFQELQAVYAKLTSSSGDDFNGGMSCEQFMQWDEVENVLVSGVLSAENIKQRFAQFVDKKPSGISERNFQLLVNQLDLSGVKRNVENGKDNCAQIKAQRLNDQMSQTSSSLLRGTLTAHYLFDALSVDDITALLADMSPLTVEQGQDIVQQNERGDLFFCIEDGTANASVNGIGVVKSYGRGDSFGEVALLHECPRSATVTATTDCKLWTLGLRAFRAVASSSSSKKIGRRREASATNKRISKRGSIVCVSLAQDMSITGTESGFSKVGAFGDVETKIETQEEVMTDMEGDITENDMQNIPKEIKEIYEELAKETDGEGVSLSAIVSWSVMQDAIQCAFMSEVIMWNEFMALVSERRKKQRTRSSISGNDLLKIDAFYQYCVKLQQIIDTNIEMTESIDEKTS